MTEGEKTDTSSQLKRSLVAIRSLRARLKAHEDARTEPVAIIGMSCRLPGGANSLDDFWRMLRDGVDGISVVPPQRWDIDAYYDADIAAPGKMTTRWGGFLDQIDLFDPAFFGIAPREALSMDPQQRLLLEVSWEALENAGQPPLDLRGSATGVFVGIASSDFSTTAIRAGLVHRIDAYSGTGGTNSVAAGRISYILGLQGPNFPIDTACSSSLVALHAACRSLRSGECDLAIVCGVNVLLMPEGTVYFSKLGAMAPDGRCKSFDSRADGYVRGEGCGVVVLRRNSDAIDRGDRIHAVIRGTAVNHDGRSNGLTAPNGAAQEAVLRQALADAGIDRNDVSYIEAHGTGTALGDPIEVQALASVFSDGRDASNPLMLGTVKTNIGHLEAAAGIAGLIKAALMLGRGEIPPNLHFRTPSSYIDWDAMPLMIPTEHMPWTTPAATRIAGVSSFGFSGTNAHALLESSPAIVEPESERMERPYEILCLSARDTGALDELVEQYRETIRSGHEGSFADLCFTANAGRSHFESRIAVVAGNEEEAIEALAGIRDSRERQGSTDSQGAPRIAFLFPGRASPPGGITSLLYETQSAFRDVVDECGAFLDPLMDRTLLSILFPEEGRESAGFGDAVTQPAIFAVELALDRLWRSWGVRPSIVLGEGVGEVAAACSAGLFSLESGLRLAVARGRFLQATAEPGGGDDSAIEAFADVAAGLEFGRLMTGLISGSTGELAAQEDVGSALYWRERIEERDLADRWLSTLDNEGILVFLEVGPGSNLIDRCRKGLPRNDGEWIRSLGDGGEDWSRICEGLATLYSMDVQIDWKKFDQNRTRRKISLPTYPFQRKRYWPENVSLAVGPPSPSGTLPPLEPMDNPLLGSRIATPREEVRFCTALEPGRPAFLGEHRVHGHVVVPATAYLEMALAAALESGDSTGCRLVNFTIFEGMVLAEGETKQVHLFLSPAEEGGRARVEIFSRIEGSPVEPTPWRKHTECEVDEAPPSLTGEDGLLEANQERCSREVPVSEFYETIKSQGYEYGASFRGIRQLFVGRLEALGRIEPPESISNEMDLYRMHPAFLDAALQVVAATVLTAERHRSASDAAYLPVSIEEVNFPESQSAPLWAHASIRLGDPGGDLKRVTSDVTLFDLQGRSVMEIRGLVFARVERDIIARLLHGERPPQRYEIQWEPFEIPAQDPPHTERKPSCWLVFTDSGGLGDRLAERVRSRGDRPILVRPGGALTKEAEDKWVIAPDAPGDYFALLEALLSDDSSPLRRIVHMSGIDVEGPDQASGWKSLLYLIQALSRFHGDSVPRLAITTRNARFTGHETALEGLFQSTAWGLGGVAALEYPALGCLRVDLDAGMEDGDTIALLVDLIESDHRENQAALRAGALYVSRLVRCRGAALHKFGPQPDPDAAYMVTGGFGSLGLILAEWLVDRGARNLFLVGHHPASEKAEGVMDLLRERGAHIEACQADIASTEEVADLFEKIDGQSPIRGVVHAAGILDDGLLAQLTAERFERVLTPKVQGAWLLHQHTKDRPLDFFILFSSVASITGSPGQGNYVAANSFLDSLAHYRRLSGRTALSVNWGPWAADGMSSMDGHGTRARWAMQGADLLRPESALAELDALLASDTTQAMVASLSWERLRDRLGDTLDQPFLSRIVADMGAGKPGRSSVKRRGAFLRKLEKVPANKQRALLLGFLNDQVALSLGLPPDEPVNRNQSLLEMGMDSMMAAEMYNTLQTALGRAIPPTLVFDYPTIEGLAGYLASEVLHLEGAGEEARDPVVERRRDEEQMELREIDELSEEELLKSIQDEIGRFNKT